VRRRFLRVLAIYAVLHVYVWWRLIWPLPSPAWQIATALILVLAPMFPLTLRFARRLPRENAKPYLLVGYGWFALATYFLLGAAAEHIATAFGAPRTLAAYVCLAGAVAIVIGGAINVALGPRVRRVSVPLAKLRVPTFKIVQLTDVHIGTLIGREFAETLVRRVNAEKPDAIVITGDLIDGRLSELTPHIEPLRDLRARHGVYCVTGNHEYYWDAAAWVDHIRSLGIRVLRNERVTLEGELEIAGTDDSTAGEDVTRATAGHDPALPLVLLAHHPRTVERAIKAGVDLQLSGHTHGGQLLPFGWLARLWDPKVSGLARFGSTYLYVSDGTGYWGPPVRVGTRCEITALELRSAKLD
jgi:predicted MPP superfamily phosphohydrolase